MKIVIVAAGLATRLQPLTNFIPKILVNIGKRTGLVEMVDYWQEYSNDFTIIVHPKFETLVQEYFDLYFAESELNLTIKTIDTALGTAHTIYNTIQNEYIGDNIMFTWCDVIPKEEIEPWAFKQDICVFTNRSQANRYQFTHKKLEQVTDGSGDVIGMYYIKNYGRFEFVEGQDFADCIDQFGLMTSYHLSNMIDFGDLDKLNLVLDSVDEAREFNTLEFTDTSVKKKANNEQGRVLINREASWYHQLNAVNIDKTVIVPDAFAVIEVNGQFDSLVMSRVDGDSIYKTFSSETEESQRSITSKVIGALENLHSLDGHTVPIEQARGDIRIEALTKIKSRCKEISGVIEAFGPVNTVNGKTVLGFGAVINGLHRFIDKFYVTQAGADERIDYSLIHGDPQFSNTMLNKNGDVVFIDPRGYFGQTQNYGLAEYDYAKVLYSLSGYDVFNYSRDFHLIQLGNGKIEFDIPKLDVKFDSELYFNDIEKAWLAVIWLGLAGYIKNNPVKSVAAYYHGLYLGTQFIESHV